MIPRLPFARLCREILDQHARESLKVSSEAFSALQQLSEAIIVLFFELCNKAAMHGKRVTVMPRDAQFVKDFVRVVDPTNPIGDAVPVKTPAQSEGTNRKTAYKMPAQRMSGITKTKGKAIAKKTRTPIVKKGSQSSNKRH